MGRFQQVTSAFGFAACVALGGGCIHVHRDADGNLKSVNLKAPETRAPEVTIIPEGPLAPDGLKPPEMKVDPAVKQAGATVPAQATASIASLAKFAGKGELARGTASEMALTWQNKIAYLPDPTHDGNMVAGLVGQLFLFAPGYQPVPANGKIVIELFDENANSTRLGGWTLDKDTLKKLITKDERFGKCYALFLPWPDYKPENTRIKLTARYDQEHCYPLYARPSTLSLDTAISTPVTIHQSQFIGGSVGAGPISGGFMGLPPSAPPQPTYVPPLNPVPIGGRSATSLPTATGPSAPPPNLPPLVITAGSR